MSQQPPYPPQPPYGQQPYGGYPPPQNHPSATTSLVLGIISLVACGLLTGIPAMLMGRSALRDIRSQPGRYGGEGVARAGFWTGLVGTAWSAVVTVLVLGVFSFGGAVHSSIQNSCQTINQGPTTSSC
jgi:hypothetical protein